MIERPWRVCARLSDEERKRIWEQAETSFLTVSEFIRRRALGKQIVSKADLCVLGELRRLGGLLKHIHLETRGIYSELTADAIRALESYTRTLERSFKEKEKKDAGSDSLDSQNPSQT